jgi:predicted nucleic acid-binding protein
MRHRNSRSTILDDTGPGHPDRPSPPDMEKPLAYVETTIPSFFHTTRTAASARARRRWTRRWWQLAPDRYRLVTSNAVLEELRVDTYPSREAALALVADLPILDLTPAVADIVAAYIQHRLMPANPTGDALHLALASYHKCDFLVTWNCRHLANANKFGHVRRLNNLLGLFVPVLATPLALLGDADESFS